MKDTLYISGPMTGIPDYNYPVFDEVKRELLAAGYEVLSPADLPIRDDWEWIDYMLIDIASVFSANGIALLPGWKESKGARIETRIAECRGIPIKQWKEWTQ